MAQIKLAVFDLEGTVFKKSYKLLSGIHHESAWGALCHHLCEEARKEDDVNRVRHSSKGKTGIKYPYSEWVLDTLKIYKKYGLTRDQFYEVINSVEYFEGAEKTFKSLHENNIKIAAVSGGLKALADRVVIDHGLEHIFAAAELHWCDKGNLRNWNIMPTDFQQKRSIVEMLLADMHIEPEECAFVGDGINDCFVAEYVGVSVAFNSKYKELTDVVDHIISQETGKEDLSAALNYIL